MILKTTSVEIKKYIEKTEEIHDDFVVLLKKSNPLRNNKIKKTIVQIKIDRFIEKKPQ